jgi:hypothetical protein
MQCTLAMHCSVDVIVATAAAVAARGAIVSKSARSASNLLRIASTSSMLQAIAASSRAGLVGDNFDVTAASAASSSMQRDCTSLLRSRQLDTYALGAGGSGGGGGGGSVRSDRRCRHQRQSQRECDTA